jgi:hypothetical protein
MADLLECVLQIKGLRGTIDRLDAVLEAVEPARWERAASPGAPTATALLARLSELEAVHGACLRLMLAVPRPLLPAVEEEALLTLGRYRQWSAAEANRRFRARRLDNLEILERCSSEELARTGVHPQRRVITVADLVAIMLATDVEHVGEIRRCLGR